MRSVVDRLTGVRRRTPSTDAIALTFDDGPDPVFTPKVLDILDAHAVPATFFVVGRHAQRHPQLVHDIVARGHALGSHSHTHRDPAGLSLRALIDDYRSGRRVVEELLGAPVRLFRPPLGVVGARGAIAIRRCGLVPWRWSVDPEDWRPGSDAGAIAGVVARAGAGDVVVLHDGIALPVAASSADRGATLEALAPIIRRARDEGLAFRTLTEGR